MPRLLALFALLALCPLAARADHHEGEGFTPLFDGKTLDGWEKKGGEASYAVEEGAIVGTSAVNTENTFLCTKKAYGDFVLTYEFQCDPRLNSGVQFRAQWSDQPTETAIDGKTYKFPAGRVHGYQAEIDPNKPDRAWFCGIYDEGRRGWLYPGPKGGDGSAFTEQGKALYKPEQWNSVRIECRGDHIQTFLNGELRADFHDDVDASGFIGLQVHGVGDEATPLTVRWRNLKIKEL